MNEGRTQVIVDAEVQDTRSDLRLTEELAGLLALTPDSLALDVAYGKGANAFFFAEKFGCRVVGVDLSEDNVQQANAEALPKGLSEKVNSNCIVIVSRSALRPGVFVPFGLDHLL